jgi:hypothetical protein
MTWLTSGRESWRAGHRPKRIPVPTAIAMLKKSTGRLMRMAASWGKENSGRLATAAETR